MIPDTVHRVLISSTTMFEQKTHSQLRSAGVAFLLLFLVWTPAAAYAEEAKPEEPTSESVEAVKAEEELEIQDTEQERAGGKWYQGSIRAGFDGIWSRGDRDIELDQFLRFGIDPPEHERLRLRGAVWMIEKIDPPSSRRSGLRDLNDTFNERILTRVSSLYLDVDDLWGDSTLRLGRQRISEGAAYNRIDGLYFKQKQTLWDWYVFGGTRATFYGDNFDDPVYGAGVSITPSGRTRLALDTYVGREHQYSGRRLSFHGPVAALYLRLTERSRVRTAETVMATVSLWHTVNENLSLFGRLNWYDKREEELLLNASGHLPGALNLTYEITYRRQFNSVGERTSDITGFYRLMGVYEGYDNLFLAVYRPITEKVMISLETELHWTRSANWANRDYQRYAAHILGEKLFGEASLDAKVGLERWNASKGGASWAVVGEIGRRWERVQLALGADYHRYKDRVIKYNETLMWLDMARVWFAPGRWQGYNPLIPVFNNYFVEMEEDIYSFYLRGRWHISEVHELSVRLTYEDGDSPHAPYKRVQADYTYRF